MGLDLLRYTSDSASTEPDAEFSRRLFEDPVLYSACVAGVLAPRKKEERHELTYFIKREMSAPDADKSAVIASLRSESGNVKSEEGINLEGDGFRVLIIPHDKKSLYRIYVESRSMELSKELCEYYENRINESKK